jgi:putative DNA primase/helicase
MDNREDLVEFLHRWAGYCLTGSSVEHALVLATGIGRNGKGTFVRVLKHVFGEDLSAEAAPGLLMATKFERHPTELRALKGRRLVTASEVATDGLFNEERVKRLAGGDDIQARGMGEDFDEFTPTHKFILGVNKKPEVRDTSEGFWARLRVVPFDVSFLGREDHELEPKLKAEAEGVLAWCVRGAMAWAQSGLGRAEAIDEAKAEYRRAQDQLGRYLAERAEEGLPMDDVPASLLHDHVVAWARTNDERAPTKTGLGRELLARGFKRKRTKTGALWDLTASKQLDLMAQKESE